MRADVMEHFGLHKSFTQCDYYETEHYRQLFNDIKTAILEGRRSVRSCGKREDRYHETAATITS